MKNLNAFWKRILKFLGVEKNPEQKWRIARKVRFFLFVSFFLFVISLTGLTIYSTSPSFCRSCHIMEPYYQAWAASKHNEVSCVDCHYPPGDASSILWKKFQALAQVAKFVTRTYSSRPYAEVEDASCLRSGCHATRLLHGRVISESGILFDHRPHLEGVRYGRQLRCVSCHSQIVVGKHIEVKWDTCYLCHFKGHKEGRAIEPLGGCRGCHVLPDREVKVGNITYNHKNFLGDHTVACQSCHQDVIQGEGDVPEERCLTCHNQPEKLARFKETDFLHANHVTQHNTACFLCHREMRHGATPAGKKSLTYDCSICHSDMHDLERDFYRGVAVPNLPPMPSPMYLANVDCVGCHVDQKPVKDGPTHAKTYHGSEKGCTRCHSEAYTGVLAESKALTMETVSRLKEKLDALNRISPAPADPDFRRILNEASQNLRVIESTHTVHNIYYAAAILTGVHETLTALSKKIQAKAPDTSQLPLVNGNFCATLCHVKVGVTVPPEKVVFRGKEMPHRAHSEEGLACASCHTFGVHKEVRLKKTLNCERCHEEEKK